MLEIGLELANRQRRLSGDLTERARGGLMRAPRALYRSDALLD